ncbi:MAG: nicotinic acid mononucleotide adenylyltransferase [Rhodospirillaceae bacterium]|nr:MAG: nicotinic acid mononucleotide adenylyltransferase [Rhodospirillaceae bacterium]
MTDQKTKRRIGLLGGSFNPAHEGHVHISELSLDLLGLDEVWWLVSPQNPLKGLSDMATLDDRVANAKAVVKDFSAIKISDVERKLGTRYTVDTLTALKTQHTDCDFVWIMGADNLRQMVKWKGWRTIFRTLPIAVFPRAPYSLRALSGRAAKCFSGAQIPSASAKKLVDLQAPAWVFLKAPTHEQSATRIRRRFAL